MRATLARKVGNCGIVELFGIVCTLMPILYAEAVLVVPSQTAKSTNLLASDQTSVRTSAQTDTVFAGRGSILRAQS